MKKTTSYPLLIKHLSSTLVPQKPYSLWRPILTLMIILLITLPLGVWHFHVRPDWEMQLHNPANYLFLLGLVCALGLSIYGAILSGIPGRQETVKRSLIVTGILVGGLVIKPMFNPFTLHLDNGVSCSLIILTLSAIPFGCTWWMIRKLAPTRPAITGVLACTSAALAGNLGLTFICPATEMLHLLLWHFFPIGVLAWVGFLIGRWLFSWQQR